MRALVINILVQLTKFLMVDISLLFSDSPSLNSDGLFGSLRLWLLFTNGILHTAFKYDDIQNMNNMLEKEQHVGYAVS